MGAEICENMQEDCAEEEPRKQPSVIKWEGGGQTVFVSFDSGATKIPMVKRWLLLSHFYIFYFFNSIYIKFYFFV